MPQKSPKPAPSKKVEKAQKIGFFRAIPASIWSPKFYAIISQRSFWQAFKYFFGVSTLILLGLMIAGGVFVMKYKDVALEKFQSIPGNYPEELVITMQGGKLSTNVEEPFMVPIPESWGNVMLKEVKMKNLIVIDTQTPFSISAMKDYGAFIWVGETSIFMNSDQEVRIYDISTVPDGQLTKETIGVMWMTIENMLGKMMIGIVIAGMMGFYLGIIVYEMVYLLFFALLAMILAGILKTKLTYGDCYKMGFHVLTVSFLLTFLIQLTKVWTNFYGFWLMQTIVMLLVLGANLWEAKRQKLL